MSKDSFLVIAACFLILSILSFVGGFVVSKAIHESKTVAPIVIHQGSAEHALAAVLEKKLGLPEAPKAELKKEAEPKAPAPVPHPAPIALPVSVQPGPMAPVGATAYPNLGVSLDDTNPYPLAVPLNRQESQTEMNKWRSQPYKNLDQSGFSVPSFEVDRPARPMDPAVAQAIANI